MAAPFCILKLWLLCRYRTSSSCSHRCYRNLLSYSLAHNRPNSRVWIPPCLHPSPVIHNTLPLVIHFRGHRHGLTTHKYKAVRWEHPCEVIPTISHRRRCSCKGKGVPVQWRRTAYVIKHHVMETYEGVEV